MVNQFEGTLDTYGAEKTESFQKTKGIDAPYVRTNEDPLPTAAKEQLLQQAEFEEGGFRAWATVLGAMLLQSAGFGYTNTFGVYQDYYTRVYITNSTSSAIAWIGSMNAFLVIASGVYVGILFDRGHFYRLIYGGSLLTSFSLFMLSLTQPNHLYQNFLAQGVGLGLGSGMMFIPSISVVSQYFVKKRALAMTLVAAGSSVGAIIHPIMLNNLLYTRLGFANSVRASAGLVTVCQLIGCSLIRERNSVRTANPPPMWQSLKRYAKEPAYVALSLGMFFFTVGFYFPIFYIELDATLHGINRNFAFYSLVLLNGCGFIGRVGSGLLASKLGVINLIVAACYGCSALIFAMIGLRTIASVVVIAILYGLLTGVFIGLQSPLVVVLTKDMSELGTRMGISFTFCAFGALIGPPIHGALLTDEFVWWRPAVLSGIFAAFGASLFVCILYEVNKQKRTLESLESQRTIEV